MSTIYLEAGRSRRGPAPGRRGRPAPRSAPPATRRKPDFVGPAPAAQGSGTAEPMPAVTTYGGATPAPAATSALSELVGQVLSQVKKQPVAAPPFRLLNAAEQQLARSVYGNSLELGRIVITPAIGLNNRKFTVAVPLSGKWWVALNMGSLANWATPGSRAIDLVHELAHAWQSQHHPSPTAFMWSSLTSQGAAAAKSKLLGGSYGVYAYVPGKSFGEYGAEQIAQQAEDTFAGRGTATPTILPMMRAAAPGKAVAYNVLSLAVVGFEKKGDPGVVWR